MTERLAATWTAADSAELSGWREDIAAIKADLAAIKARLDRTLTFMGWMLLATAYVAFIAVAFGLL